MSLSPPPKGRHHGARAKGRGAAGHVSPLDAACPGGAGWLRGTRAIPAPGGCVGVLAGRGSHDRETGMGVRSQSGGGDDARLPSPPPPPDNRAPNTGAGGAGAGRGPGVPLRGERPGARYRPRRRRRPTHAPPPPPRRSGAERDGTAPEPPPPQPQVTAAPGRARGGALPLLRGAPGAVSPGTAAASHPSGMRRGRLCSRLGRGVPTRVHGCVCARSHVPAAACPCLQAGVRVCVCLRVGTACSCLSACPGRDALRVGSAPPGGVTGGTGELCREKGSEGWESFGAACVTPASAPRATWPRAGVGAGICAGQVCTVPSWHTLPRLAEPPVSCAAPGPSACCCLQASGCPGLGTCVHGSDGSCSEHP